MIMGVNLKLISETTSGLTAAATRIHPAVTMEKNSCSEINTTVWVKVKTAKVLRRGRQPTHSLGPRKKILFHNYTYFKVTIVAQWKTGLVETIKKNVICS